MNCRQHVPAARRARGMAGGLLPLALIWCILGAGGCAQQLKPIFEEAQQPLVWPAPPKPARIRYVGQLRTAADLKPPRGFLQPLGEFVFGSKPDPRLYGPRAAVLTPDGARLWVADPGGRCVHLFDLEHRAYKKITGVGTSPLLAPVGLCLGPLDSIYVCDSESIAIHRLDGTTGGPIQSLPLPEDIIRPTALSFDEVAQELFVVDVSAHDVKVLSVDGSIRRIIGRRGEAAGEFNYPSAIADDGKLLWVVDTGNHRVQGLTRDGDPVTTFGQAGDAPGDLALPKGVALDSDGHLYVVDGRFENVQVFDREGRLLLFFGEEGIGPGQFWLPGGVFVDGKDRVWVCDTYNGRVQVFDYTKVTDEAPEP